jgi:hypothetical protein
MVMEMAIVAPQNGQLSRRAVRWDVLNAAVLALGLSAVLLGAATAAFSTLYLPMADGRSLGGGVTILGQPIDTAWGFIIALTAFGMVACAGLPSRRDTPRSLSGAFGQGFGGVVLAGSSMLVLLLINTTGPFSGSCCFQESRGTFLDQPAAVAIPSVVAGLLMIAAAFLVRRIRWWVRALVPALVWVAALLVQQAIWSR